MKNNPLSIEVQHKTKITEIFNFNKELLHPPENQSIQHILTLETIAQKYIELKKYTVQTASCAKKITLKIITEKKKSQQTP